MDWWGFLGTFLAVLFGVATIVLALRLARRKKPVWASNTKKIIGVDTDAPSEIQLLFHNKLVNDIWRTTILFFNRGNETIIGDKSIGKVDVTENVTMHFREGQILRQPIITAKSNEANKFYAKQVVKDGDNAVEIGFAYLDHNHGAVIEVIHTESKPPHHSGNIISAETVNIGEYDPVQTRPGIVRPVIVSVLLILAISFIVMYAFSIFKIDAEPLSIIILFSFVFVLMLTSDIRSHVRYNKFPKWSRLEKRTTSSPSLESQP